MAATRYDEAAISALCRAIEERVSDIKVAYVVEADVMCVVLHVEWAVSKFSRMRTALWVPFHDLGFEWLADDIAQQISRAMDSWMKGATDRD